MKINYIVVCFFGHRRANPIKEPIYYLRYQLHWLAKHRPDIANVDVILNVEKDGDIESAQSIINSFKPFYTGLRLFARPNFGFSYKAWSERINGCIKNNEEFSHYILTEDDYAPYRTDFIKVLLSKMTNSVGYVCQKKSIGPDGHQHAAMSSGILLGAAAEEAVEKYGSALKIHQPATPDSLERRSLYHSAEIDQVGFLNNIYSLGYSLEDCSDIARTKFLASLPGNNFYIKWFDQSSGTQLFNPILKESRDVE